MNIPEEYKEIVNKSKKQTNYLQYDWKLLKTLWLVWDDVSKENLANRLKTGVKRMKRVYNFMLSITKGLEEVTDDDFKKIADDIKRLGV